MCTDAGKASRAEVVDAFYAFAIAWGRHCEGRHCRILGPRWGRKFVMLGSFQDVSEEDELFFHTEVLPAAAD